MNLEKCLQRLDKLEAANQIRNLMSQYMHLCDDLSYPDIAQEIADLFCEDAIWKVSAVYTKTNWDVIPGEKTLPK